MSHIYSETFDFKFEEEKKPYGKILTLTSMSDELGCHWITGERLYTSFEELNKKKNIEQAAPELLEALQDMLAGWKYIRSFHGDLYGVGWDRAQSKAEEAIKKATQCTA